MELVHFAVLKRQPIPPGNRHVAACGDASQVVRLTTDSDKVTCETCKEIAQINSGTVTLPEKE